MEEHDKRLITDKTFSLHINERKDIQQQIIDFIINNKSLTERKNEIINIKINKEETKKNLKELKQLFFYS